MSDNFKMSPEAYLAISEGCSQTVQVAVALGNNAEWEKRWRLLRFLRDKLNLLELERYAEHEQNPLLALPDPRAPGEKT
jgi:HEAT repeat protein